MQPAEANQHAAVNSRQTLQGTDVDIKELALRVAKEMPTWGAGSVIPENYITDFATRLIAAYLKEQNSELVAALELCKKHMVGDKWDSLFIDGVLSKVKQT